MDVLGVDIGAFDAIDFFVAFPVAEVAVDSFGGGLAD